MLRAEVKRSECLTNGDPGSVHAQTVTAGSVCDVLTSLKKIPSLIASAYIYIYISPPPLPLPTKKRRNLRVFHTIQT